MPHRLGIHRLAIVRSAVIIGMMLATGLGRAQHLPPPDLPEDPATVIAVVGQSPILLGDLLPKAQSKITEVMEKTGQEIPEAELANARKNLIRGFLAQSIQNKMMRESFLLDQVGTAAADKRAEADAKLTSRARMMFFESELPELMKQYNTDDRTELDDKLRKKGTSLAARQREFVDSMLGHLYIRSKVDREPKVSIAEINEYYQTHLDDYARPSRARWEQLTALFSRFPDKESAQTAIWEMGREAYFGGNMQAVAKQKSQEPFASSGGLHDWTPRGSLASKTLDEQIFTIPTDRMSEVIEDDTGFHIIRVVERQDAGLIPLSEVQDEIRSKLRQEKIATTQRKVMEEMQDRIPVWSLYYPDTPGAMPMPQLSLSRSTSAADDASNR